MSGCWIIYTPKQGTFSKEADDWDMYERSSSSFSCGQNDLEAKLSELRKELRVQILRAARVERAENAPQLWQALCHPSPAWLQEVKIVEVAACVQSKAWLCA